MKFLLAIAMTTVLTGTAFGACSSATPRECKSEADCKKLSTTDGPQFEMVKTTDGSVCNLKESAVATNCTEGNSTGRSDIKPAGTTPAGTTPDANTIKR